MADGEDGGGWQTVIEEPQSFELVALTGIEEVLGNSELTPGLYGQVRMDVAEALITVEGEELPATIPSGVLRLVGGFELVSGETTVLTLDFDAERSVVLRSNMDPLLKPTVKLLVRRSGQSLKEAEEVGESVEDFLTPVPSPQVPETTTVTLNPSKDNTLFEDEDGNLSSGAGQGFIAGVTNGGQIRRGLIEFDIAGNIPEGASITDVTLALHLARTSSSPHSVSLHKVSQEWGEGASVATSGEGVDSAEGDATWIHTSFSTTLWDNSGGDFDATVSAIVVVAEVGGRYTWGSTSEMVADVQAWLSDDSSNHGWLLLGNESSVQTTKMFSTRESSVAENWPVLTVTFLP